MLPFGLPAGHVILYNEAVRSVDLAEAFSLMENKSITPYAILVHPDIADMFLDWAKGAIDCRFDHIKTVPCDRIYLPEPTHRLGLMWKAEVFPHPVMKPGMVLVLGELPYSWVKGAPIDFDACIIFQRVGTCPTPEDSDHL